MVTGTPHVQPKQRRYCVMFPFQLLYYPYGIRSISGPVIITPHSFRPQSNGEIQKSFHRLLNTARNNRISGTDFGILEKIVSVNFDAFRTAHFLPARKLKPTSIKSFTHRMHILWMYALGITVNSKNIFQFLLVIWYMLVWPFPIRPRLGPVILFLSLSRSQINSYLLLTSARSKHTPYGKPSLCPAWITSYRNYPGHDFCQVRPIKWLLEITATFRLSPYAINN